MLKSATANGKVHTTRINVVAMLMTTAADGSVFFVSNYSADGAFTSIKTFRDWCIKSYDDDDPIRIRIAYMGHGIDGKAPVSTEGLHGLPMEVYGLKGNEGWSFLDGVHQTAVQFDALKDCFLRRDGEPLFEIELRINSCFSHQWKDKVNLSVFESMNHLTLLTDCILQLNISSCKIRLVCYNSAWSNKVPRFVRIFVFW